MSEIARYINTNQLSYQTSVIHELNLLFRFTNTEQKPVLALSLFNFDDFSTLGALTHIRLNTKES